MYQGTDFSERNCDLRAEVEACHMRGRRIYVRVEVEACHIRRRMHTCGMKLKHVESAQSLSPKRAMSPTNC
jgi:hypothetical protein